ncbi:MAG: phosphotransferase [Caulobacteraceae bacterium]
MTFVLADEGVAPPAIPSAPEAMTADWLTAALVAGGRPAVRVAAAQRERIGEGVGVLAELYRLRLTYAQGGAAGPASLIAKLRSSNPEVRELCAAYGLYEREVRFYKEIAGAIELRTPEPYFSAFDAVSGDFVILMEDLAPAASPDQVAGASLADLTAAVDGVAALHARWWGHPRLTELRAIMPSVAEPPYARGAENYRACLPAALEALRARGHDALARIAGKIDGAIEQMLAAIAAEPLTLAHGDFRVDNLMFRKTPAGPELTVVDWQVVMQARGPFDLGYLMGGAAPTDLRRAHEAALLRRYHDTLIRQGVTGYSFDDCLLDYRRAVLFSLVYWVEGVAMVDHGNARAVALFECWADRLAAAAADLDLEALIDV